MIQTQVSELDSEVMLEESKIKEALRDQNTTLRPEDPNDSKVSKRTNVKPDIENSSTAYRFKRQNTRDTKKTAEPSDKGSNLLSSPYKGKKVESLSKGTIGAGIRRDSESSSQLRGSVVTLNKMATIEAKSTPLQEKALPMEKNPIFIDDMSSGLAEVAPVYN